MDWDTMPVDLSEYIGHTIIATFTFRLNNLPADGLMHTITISLYADDYISTARALCIQTEEIEAPAPCFMPTFDCENCIGGFVPDIGATYAISAWIKEASAPDTATGYYNATIQIDYTGPVTDPAPYYGKGKIIEGWQRIYEEFTIPSGATDITVELLSGSGTAYFDDIRIYPVNGSMKSYIYDPVSLKLTAVLDENNYATLYEYDQEGSLVRTKKETDRGVVTISENRQSNPKR